MNKQIENQSKETEIQVWLSEYRAINRRILASMWRGYGLVGFNIVAIGTFVILTVLSPNTQDFFFMATMSLLSSCLGIIWASENRHSIITLHSYLVDIAKALQELTGNPRVMSGYALALTPNRKSSGIANIILHGSPSAIIGLFLFFSPSLVSLVVGFDKMVGIWYQYLFLIVDILLVILLIAAGWLLNKDWSELEEKYRQTV